MKRKSVSCDLPAGVDVTIWQNDTETVIRGSIIPITIVFDVPMDEATKTRAKLRGLVGQL